MERRGVRYTGRVQGVGFRAKARAVAGRHAVTGWVRNQADGSVQLEVQGPKDRVEGFLATLRNQMGAMVQGEWVDVLTPVDGETVFEIRR